METLYARSCIRASYSLTLHVCVSCLCFTTRQLRVRAAILDARPGAERQGTGNDFADALNVSSMAWRVLFLLHQLLRPLDRALHVSKCNRASVVLYNELWPSFAVLPRTPDNICVFFFWHPLQALRVR